MTMVGEGALALGSVGGRADGTRVPDDRTDERGEYRVRRRGASNDDLPTTEKMGERHPWSERGRRWLREEKFFWKNAGELRLNILRRRDKSRSKRSGQITRPPQGGQKHRKLKKSIKLNNSLVSRN
jgi:hypothetical protein